MRRRWGAVLLVLVVALCAGVAASATQATVTVIGDSVADAMEHSPHALESLNDGFEVNLQTRGCRRLRAPSCTIVGCDGPPPTTLQVVKRLGPSLGEVVVVDVGYNDTPHHYDRDLDAVMRALQNVGVETVIWLTLRDPNRDYAASNEDIKREPKEWPQLVVADWDEHSDGHPLWFESDGIHLTKLGAANLGEFIHRALVRHAGP
jgi:ribosomal protein L25 (general stress protein Ctc)